MCGVDYICLGIDLILGAIARKRRDWGPCGGGSWTRGLHGAEQRGDRPRTRRKIPSPAFAEWDLGLTMATKAVPDVPSPMPPPPSPADSLLASSISLPPSPTVAVAVYRPTVSLDSLSSAHDVIELARRQVLSRNTSPILLDNILPHVCCGKQPTLYLFQLTTQDEANSALHRFSELHFENLDRPSHLPECVYHADCLAQIQATLPFIYRAS